MANKVGMVLSLLLFAQAMLFCGDLIGYQLAISKISIQSSYITRQIESERMVTDNIKLDVKETLNADILCENECQIDENGMIKITIQSSYKPLLIWVWQLGVPNISMNRTIFVGKGGE